MRDASGCEIRNRGEGESAYVRIRTAAPNSFAIPPLEDQPGQGPLAEE